MSKEIKVDLGATQVAAPVTPNQLLQTAIDKGTDMEQLSKLMDLQERWEANEARKAYVTAMSHFRENCPAIVRTKKAHNSTYAGLAETIDQIKFLLSESGLSHSWKTEQVDGLTTVTCCVTHVRGHQECTSLSAAPDSSGSKNSIQAVGSTISYLQRYTLFAILGLASQEMDNDGGAPLERIDEELANKIHAKLTENEINMDGFMNWLKRDLKVNAIEEIPLKAYNTVNKRIDSAIRAKGDK